MNRGWSVPASCLTAPGASSRSATNAIQCILATLKEMTHFDGGSVTFSHADLSSVVERLSGWLPSRLHRLQLQRRLDLCVGGHELRLGERGKHPADTHQFVERTAFDNAAVLKDHNAGGVAHR